MEPNVKLIPDSPQVQLLDEEGHVIGVITLPVEPERVLGPGREKVYLARHPGRTSHAA